MKKRIKAYLNFIDEILANRKPLDVVAKEVINGDWNTGKKRKTKLMNSGYDYEEVMKKVDELSKFSWTKWEKSLKDTAIELRDRGVEYQGSGSKAGKIEDYTDCSGYIQEALYNMGCFLKGESFYLSKDLQGTKRAVEYLKKHFKIIYPKKIWSKASLKEGDIVGFDWGDGVHTMVYAGTVDDNGETYPVWYSFGGSTPFSEEPVRKPFYEDKTVYVKMRYQG